MIAFYNGVSGMMAYQEAMNVIGHNVANVNTVGYKPGRSSFSDLLYTQMNTRVEGENLVGHGVKHQDTDLIYKEGSLDMTERPLDFTITGPGFFGVEVNGQTEYTRAGNFYLSPESGGLYLVTGDGGYVKDAKGARIALEVNEQGVAITQGLEKRLGIYTFANPFGLEPVNEVRFLETTTSGKATQLGETGTNGVSADGTAAPKAMQGALERSGTDLGGEMVRMIEAQRAFQFNARVVQTADELDTTINNLR